MFRERGAPSPAPSGDLKTTRDKVVHYYQTSPSYLDGPLQGSCHFGYTEKGERFDLDTALHSMELLLGQTLNLPPGSQVLDAGCGYGRVARTLHEEFGYDVIGIDLVQERLIETKRFTQEHGIAESINLVRGSYTAIPLRDNSVSAVYTVETLVHADPLEDALSEFWRVLEPGGKLVLFEYSVPDREKLDPLRRKITDTMVDRTGMTSIERFVHGSFPELLQVANFENITVQEISRNVYPTWRHLFWLAIREQWPSIPKKVLRGELMDTPNLAGSLFIWPYRSQLGYNIISATKPLTAEAQEAVI